MPTISRRGAIITAAVYGALLAAIYQPIPISTDWGEIARKDVSAKASIMERVKSEVSKLKSDGKLEPYELAGIYVMTDPGFLMNHRVRETRTLGIFDDDASPKIHLNDTLRIFYAGLLSADTNGQLASYHQMREAIFRELYSRFLRAEHISYERFLRLEGFDWKRSNEDEREWFNRHFTGPVNLANSDLGKLVDSEIEKASQVFSSAETQGAIVEEIKQIGNAKNRDYNILFSIPLTLLGMTMIEPILDRRKRRKIGAKIADGMSFFPKAYFDAIGDMLNTGNQK